MNRIALMGSLAFVLAGVLPISAGADRAPQISDCHAGNMPKLVFQDCIKRQGRAVGSNSAVEASATEPGATQEEAQNTAPPGDNSQVDDGDYNSSPPAGMREREHGSTRDAQPDDQYAGPIDQAPPDADRSPDDAPDADGPRWGGPDANGFDAEGPPDAGPPYGNWRGHADMGPDEGGPPGDEDDGPEQ